MSDSNLVVYLIAFAALGSTFSALGVYAVKAASGTRTTTRGRALTGSMIGLGIGLLLGTSVETVLSHMFKMRSDLATAAVVGGVLGVLAGVSGSTLRGAAGGLVSGLLFGNLVVTTKIELLARIIATIGGIIAGVCVAAMYENENPAKNVRGSARRPRADDTGEPPPDPEEGQLAEVRFKCGQCGKRLKARTQDVGRPTKCSSCGSRMRIPESA
jgi:DNA-directed RNA polymerase subunit RPC12/RpoP